jgi:1-acyl-sn-glycerol-3-phosphate acyltransferase
MLKRNIFGHYIIIRRILMGVIGLLTYPLYALFNKTSVHGMEVLDNLPRERVLFVSNHQTYFSDVILMYHAFAARRSGKDRLGIPWYLFFARANTFFIAAEETMKSGWLPRLFAYAGAIQIKRTWREAGKSIERPVDRGDVEKIRKALSSGWVITFPQGTTAPFEKGRKGTAHLIKELHPVVVPVTVKGLRRAFDKKGLKLKKRGIQLELTFKAPIELNFDDSPEKILSEVMDAIEQSEKFNKVPPTHTSAIS